jgi:DNA-binding transcriptional regulator YhcF (GntR family)
VDEAALLAELLASGDPLPSVRALSIEKTGKVRSRAVERVLEQARARMNGGSRP